MSAPVISLTVIIAIIVATMLFALLNVRRYTMSPQEYIVGNRSFGTIFLWVLLAGEIYTSFTFLGAAGWAYGFGAPAFYIFAYGTCAYIIGYFLLPPVWRFAKEHGLMTIADFFVVRYRSKPLGVAVAIVQSVMIVPYVTLQLSALQTFLTIAGYGHVNGEVAAILSFLAITLFVFLTGLRGTAWASIVKDALVIGALLFVGLAIPIHFFGSPAALLDRVAHLHPQMLTLAQGSAPHGTVWYVSTVLLTGIGFFMGPHSMTAVYSARDEGTLRRNAMLLPVYQLLMLLVFFAGFSALLLVPGLHGTSVDQSFLLVVQRYYPPAVLGVVIAAGALCALIPSTALLLSAASLAAKNVLSDGFGIAQDDRTRMAAVRCLVVAIALLALILWLTSKNTLVELLLLYYNGVTQFLPAFVFGLLWKRTTAWGVGAGAFGGIALAYYLAATNTPTSGVNPGFVALALNVTLLVAISALTSNTRDKASAYPRTD